ncbi:MAG: DUF58 domain-containing protein [Gammaproteobacteria bacterium]|nr:MAG: DUF58 domain-containing protein [Gammaproteobacteria bacterium]
MKAMIRNLYRQRFFRWLERRLPAAAEVTLNRRSLFIFPSSTGFAFFLLIVLCWLAATNYENNLVFAVTCLLVAIFVVSILQSFANLAGITVSCVRVTPGFAGQSLTLELLLKQQGKRYRGAIQCQFPHGDMTTVSLADSSQCRLKLTVPAAHRGLYNPGRLRVESRYPVGLLRAWSHIDLDISALVYPAPIFSEEVPVGVHCGDDGALQGVEGGDDFLGLQTYRPGDSLKHVAWKHYAREQGLHTKHYGDNFDQQLWLDWDQFPGLDREARLSRLCGMLLRVATTDQPYGLRLPGLVIEPDRGESHRQHLLAELALFDVPERERYL